MGIFGWLFPVPPSPSLPDLVARAEALMEQGDYEHARPLLANLTLGETGGTSALVAEALTALGECEMQLGKPATAVITTRWALKTARRVGDEATRAALGNLYEVYRYLGERDAAADLALELASLSPPPLDARYRRQAALVRGGEPLLRVVADVNGQRYEIDEVIAGVEGPVRLVYERNRLTLRLCERWTEEGEQHAHAGRFDEALALYQRAAALDPHAPAPVYQLGMVFAHQGKMPEAGQHFARAESLAPGWFHVRSALALLAAEVGPDLFRSWHALAEGPLPAVNKMLLAEQTIPHAPIPVRAHFHHLHGKALQALKRAGLAERAYRQGLEHADAPDLLTRLGVDLAAVVSSPEEKRRLLTRALEVNADLVAVATARIVLAFE